MRLIIKSLLGIYILYLFGWLVVTIYGVSQTVNGIVRIVASLMIGAIFIPAILMSIILIWKGELK